MSTEASDKSAHVPIVAVFDFDHTLTSWDTAARYFLWLLRRQYWKLGLVVLGAPLLAPCFLWRRTRKWPFHFSIWVATLNLAHQQLMDLAKLHVAEVSELVVLSMNPCRTSLIIRKRPDKVRTHKGTRPGFGPCPNAFACGAWPVCSLEPKQVVRNDASLTCDVCSWNLEASREIWTLGLLKW